MLNIEYPSLQSLTLRKFDYSNNGASRWEIIQQYNDTTVLSGHCWIPDWLTRCTTTVCLCWLVAASFLYKLFSIVGLYSGVDWVQGAAAVLIGPQLEQQ